MSNPKRSEDFGLTIQDLFRRKKTGAEITGTEFALGFLRLQMENAEEKEGHAKAAELKLKGNTAFAQGDFKTAYIIYTACMILGLGNPVYSSNRAACALKMKLYESAAVDARMAVEKAEAAPDKGGNFNMAKAFFRHGKAWYCMGKWEHAAHSYEHALELQPDDDNILHAMRELNRIRRLPEAAQVKWVAAQGMVAQADVFDPGELLKRAEEWAGCGAVDKMRARVDRDEVLKEAFQ